MLSQYATAYAKLAQAEANTLRHDERGDEDMSAVDDWLRHVQGG